MYVYIEFLGGKLSKGVMRGRKGKKTL